MNLRFDQGLMRFTSPLARDAYAQIGLYAMRAPELYWRAAARVAARMREKCGGRMFMAAHIRRGDCECGHIRDVIILTWYASCSIRVGSK